GRPAYGDFPHETWRRVLARCARRASVQALDYGSPEGLPELREAIADYTSRARAVRCGAGDIVVVNGSQQALDLAARVLVDPGDAVVLEEPHYAGARRVLEAVGARLRPVPVDAEGLRIDRLPRAARAAYVTPSHQFPTGAVLPVSRRLAPPPSAHGAGGGGGEGGLGGARARVRRRGRLRWGVSLHGAPGRVAAGARSRGTRALRRHLLEGALPG